VSILTDGRPNEVNDIYFYLLISLSGCGARNTGPQVASPGNPTSPELNALAGGAAIIQSRSPVDADADAWQKGQIIQLQRTPSEGEHVKGTR